MAVQEQRYTLFGFSKELDWRPLHFVDSIPAHRICNACGLVHRVTVFLPCRHVLCNSCYAQCLSDKVHGCPIDGDPFLEEDAQRGEFPLDSLLKRKVKCWNEDKGCEMIMAASELHQHFHEDCGHHSTRCPKCSACILISNVRAHRSSDCSADAQLDTAGTLKPDNDSSQEAVLASLEAILEKRVAEVRSGLDQLAREIIQCDKFTELTHTVNDLREVVIKSSEEQICAANEAGIDVAREVKEDLAWQGDRLNEISLRVTTLSEKVEEVLREATKKPLEQSQKKKDELCYDGTADGSSPKKVSETVSVFEGTMGKASEHARETISQMPSSNTDSSSVSKTTEVPTGVNPAILTRDYLPWFSTLNVKHYEFHVKGIKLLKERAMSNGYAGSYRGTTYLGGYCISLGVYLKKSGSSMSVHALVRLNKGVIDSFLQWPFSHRLKLTFIDSSKSTHHTFCVATIGNLYDKRFDRPTNTANDGVCSAAGCRIEGLEQQGYLRSDEFCVKCELLVSNAN
uniref:Putative tnf receptor-associated factor 6 ovary overexpressed n=1 Tax=Rhipicephalus microplus TaxID=6941 RepID=A0A6M2CNC0_RHIMP